MTNIYIGGENMAEFVGGLLIGCICGVIVTTLSVSASNNNIHENISEENANE